MDKKDKITSSEFQALFPQYALIKDEMLQAAIIEIWDELWTQSGYSDLLDVPVSLKVAYPQLKHTQAVAEMAVAVAAIVSNVHGTVIDLDTLIAGALLMDVSKFTEYRPGIEAVNERTPIGILLPHGMVSASLSLEKRLPLEVIHIILAHSPNGGKAPVTVEAQILDWLDQLDLNALGANLWTRRVVHLQP